MEATEKRASSSLPKQSSRAPVIGAVMASMFMVAIEATIVSTAMPQIVGQLGGLRLYSWVFSSFLLTQTAMTVLFGKLADIKGRKPIMLLGIAIFLIGSILAGFAWSMPSMIVFRLIQGAGAGAVQPVALTIVADLYPAHERGKVQGYLASVWAISAVLGPLAGGLIMRELTWPWVFWINVPVGIAAAIGFITFLHEVPKQEKRSIDIAGSVLFTFGVASLMTALTDVGTAGKHLEFPAIASFCICSYLFIRQEKRAPDPMISFSLWSRKPIALSNGASVLASMTLMGLTTFLPMYVQGVLHQSAVVAGLTLTMMLVGWPSGATVATRLFQKLGLREIMILGSALIPVGAASFSFLTPSSSPLQAGCGSLVMGFGMGLLSVSSLILIQEIVDFTHRGSVTSSNVFARNLGSMFGASVFGAIMNIALSHSASKGAGPITSEQIKKLLEATASSGVPESLTKIADVLQASLHQTFIAMFVISLSILALTIWVPPVVISKRELKVEALTAD
jgi:EmrB/QacA subfamily drug resistance transporter